MKKKTKSRSKQKTLTPAEESIMWTLNAEPDYQFQYDEAGRASRMVEKGLLRARKNKMCSVTAKGRRMNEQSRRQE